MSTRTNIIIVKDKDKTNNDFIQLYHHHDGYPSGVGQDLQKYIGEMIEQDFDVTSTFSVRDYLCDNVPDDEYEHEERYEFAPRPHGDINFLYVMCLNDKTIRCYKVCMMYDDVYENLESVIRGEYESKNCVFVYESGFNQTWNEVEDKYQIAK